MIICMKPRQQCASVATYTRDKELLDDYSEIVTQRIRSILSTYTFAILYIYSCIRDCVG